MHFVTRLINIQQAGRNFSRVKPFTKILERRRTAGRIVTVIHLAQDNGIATVQVDRHRLPLRIGRFDFFGRMNVVHVNDVMVMLSRVRVTLGGALVIVECDTRADDINKGKARVQERSL